MLRRAAENGSIGKLDAGQSTSHSGDPDLADVPHDDVIDSQLKRLDLWQVQTFEAHVVEPLEAEVPRRGLDLRITCEAARVRRVDPARVRGRVPAVDRRVV